MRTSQRILALLITSAAATTGLQALLTAPQPPQTPSPAWHGQPEQAPQTLTNTRSERLDSPPPSPSIPQRPTVDVITQEGSEPLWVAPPSPALSEPIVGC